MSLNPLPTANTTKQRLDAADPNTLADVLRSLGIGTILRQQRVSLRRQNPFGQAVNPYVPASMNTLTLPDDAKASALHVGGINTSSACAWVRGQDSSASTGSTGAYTAKTPWGTTPTTGTVGIFPTGDIGFLGTDAVNDVDLDYDVMKCDATELQLNGVAGTGAVALPAAVTGPASPGTGASVGVLLLMEAEIVVGTSVGKKTVLVPAAGAPAAGNARLDVAKRVVQFAVADGVAQARVKLGVCSKIDTNAVLEATSTNF